MAFHYVARSQKPTAVTSAVTAAFTGPDDLNLIVAKTTALEILRVTPDGLEAVLDVDLNAEITTVDVYHPHAGGSDWLLLATARAQFSVLAFDPATGTLQTKAQGNLRDNVGKPASNGGKAAVAPSRDLVGLYYSENLFKVIPIGMPDRFREAFNVRLDEGRVVDFCFLHNQPSPTVCILFQDARQAARVKTYTILPAQRDLAAGPWQFDAPASAHRLHPVEHGSGVLVFSSDSILHYDGEETCRAQTPGSHVFSSARVDKNRVLFSQQDGTLAVVVLSAEGGKVSAINVEPLGETSIASSLAYLDSGLVFVGSRVGDSHLVQLAPERDPETDSYLTVLETFPNLGPIVDMTVVDTDGQTQLLTCSGADRDGSIRIVRSGIGIEEQASIELPGIKAMWSMPKAFGDAHHTYLVQTFTAETRVLSIADDEMGECEISGFDAAARSLFCGAVRGGFFVQVTATGARLVDGAGAMELVNEWKPPAGSSITVAAGNASQILLAVSGGVLVYLEVDAGARAFKEVTRATMPHEIACVSIDPLTGPASAKGGSSGMEEEEEEEEEGEGGGATATALAAAAQEHRALLCAVGLWTDMSVHVLRLPSLEESAREALGGEVIPRSILLVTLEDTHYLMVGMGDGHLVSAELDVTASGAAATCAIKDRKAVSLSSGPVALSTFTNNDELHVFAASDRPSVVYSRGNKLLYSSVNLKNVGVMAPFNSETFPECLALATDEELLIGTVDEVQKLHIRTVALGEAPRRICYLRDSHTVAVTTTQTRLTADGNAEEREFVRLFDASTFTELDSLELEPYELALSVSPVELEGGHRFLAVGTGFALPGEDEPTRGRVLLVAVSKKAAGAQGSGAAMEEEEGGGAGAAAEEEEEEEEEGDDADGPEPRQLSVAVEFNAQGGCYAVRCMEGKLLVCCNTEVMTMALEGGDSPSLKVLHKCGGHVSCIFMAVVGRHVLVGDVMRAISVLKLNEAGDGLEEVERDFRTAWTSAVGFVAPGAYLSADMDGNLVCSTTNTAALNDDDRVRLNIAGEYHLGSIVNSIVLGTLSQQPGVDQPSETAATAATMATTDKVAGAGAGAGAEAAASQQSQQGEQQGEQAPRGQDEEFKVPGMPASGFMPAFLYGAIDGSVGAIFCVTREQFVTLQRLQRAMRTVVHGVGGFEHQDWRSFKDTTVTRESQGFVDGDLVEQFLDLNHEQQSKVVKELNEDGVTRFGAEAATVGQVVSYVEDLSRLH